MKERIEIVKGDITTMQVDAIVNAANTSLLGGGGVDGAIHRAGGPEILEQCRKIIAAQGGCSIGEAVITTAGKLSAKYVIHTVGPVWNGGSKGEEDLLANCYRNSLRLADEHNVQTIAFPAISTGVYRFPIDKATQIAVNECVRGLSKYDRLIKIFFVCFGIDVYNTYKTTLNETSL